MGEKSSGGSQRALGVRSGSTRACRRGECSYLPVSGAVITVVMGIALLKFRLTQKFEPYGACRALLALLPSPSTYFPPSLRPLFPPSLPLPSPSFPPFPPASCQAHVLLLWPSLGHASPARVPVACIPAIAGASGVHGSGTWRRKWVADIPVCVPCVWGGVWLCGCAGGWGWMGACNAGLSVVGKGIGGACQALSIMIFNRIYQFVLVKLTEFENWQTETQVTCLFWS